MEDLIESLAHSSHCSYLGSEPEDGNSLPLKIKESLNMTSLKYEGTAKDCYEHLCVKSCNQEKDKFMGTCVLQRWNHEETFK